MRGKPSEHSEQVALFNWANACKAQFPELGMMMAIPNGGRRDKITGARLKAEGVKAGVPDIFLAVPCGVYSGLFIEMKAGKNKPTPEQDQWAGRLARYGYLVVTCYGWWEAKVTIENYLDMLTSRALVWSGVRPCY